MVDFSELRKHHKRYRMLRWIGQRTAWTQHLIAWFKQHLPWLFRMMAFVTRYLSRLYFINPLRYIKRLDWYIIKKFIGTYIYSIALIISISIVVDVNENLAKFTEYHAPLKAIIFDYYLNFIPYFQPTICLHCRHLLHIKIGWQQRNHFNVGCRRFI